MLYCYIPPVPPEIIYGLFEDKRFHRVKLRNIYIFSYYQLLKKLSKLNSVYYINFLIHF